MTNRFERIKEYVDRLITHLDLPEKRLSATKHLSDVSSCCVLLALRRGLNPELAAISGLLHDIYRYKTGISMYHSHNSAEMARVVLNNMGDCFPAQDRRIILSAIFHHSDKLNVHGAYDEVLKDADILSRFLNDGGPCLAFKYLNQQAWVQRLKKMQQELKLAFDFPDEFNTSEYSKVDDSINKRMILADVAERIAATPVTGSRQDPSFMNLIRYWPEDIAPEGLINGWCAAFVYHCCQEAGFLLPIRWLNEDRFAGVSAWYNWARMTGYFIKDETGVIPQRGDIILYHNIIPLENRLDGQKDISIDHIGVILASDSKTCIVAEGNVNNKNTSGILTRLLHKNVEGYIRIDNSFSYDDWVFDYSNETYKS